MEGCPLQPRRRERPECRGGGAPGSQGLTLLRMWFTCETSAVMPRSLNEPVWLFPHCFTQRSFMRGSRGRVVDPEEVGVALEHRDDVLVGDAGGTHSFLDHAPEP